jgi:putative SOS response-associated peptidase YedK
MCGRYGIIPDAKAWVDGWNIARDILNELDWQARYNITPSSWIPIIRATSGGDGLVIDKARWGFVPHWVKEDKPKAQPINARSDGIATKPYFRDSFRHRRCLFIASGFYEWQTVDGTKQPFNITTKDGSPFLMAGIWDNWKGDDTAAVITTDANSLMATIHDRMPVMIDHVQAQQWISGVSPEQFLKPYPSELMRAYPVSRAVNSPKNDGPSLIEPIE